MSAQQSSIPNSASVDMVSLSYIGVLKTKIQFNIAQYSPEYWPAYSLLFSVLEVLSKVSVQNNDLTEIAVEETFTARSQIFPVTFNALLYSKSMHARASIYTSITYPST